MKDILLICIFWSLYFCGFYFLFMRFNELSISGYGRFDGIKKFAYGFSAMFMFIFAVTLLLGKALAA